VADGPVEVSRDGLVGGPHGGAGADRALYVMDAAEQEHWSRVLGGIEPGRLGENLLIVPGPAGGIDDVERSPVGRGDHPPAQEHSLLGVDPAQVVGQSRVGSKGRVRRRCVTCRAGSCVSHGCTP